MSGAAPQRVVVLLATHDGGAFLRPQLDSILGQRGVDVRVVVSDDASTDGTWAILERAAAADPRIELLPQGRFGSPRANFLRLTRDAAPRPDEAVAFADQDDLWHDDKLQRQLALLDERGLDAVSSNVTAFWERPDGSVRRRLVDKAQPQQDLDFLLESGGPGCTFLLRSDAFALVREVLVERVDAPTVPHDWLVYAIARALGLRWRIDPEPTIDYRQHGGNATGANSGARQAVARARQLGGGSYRERALAVARLTAAIAEPPLRHRIERVVPLLERSTAGSRAALARLAPQLRRSERDRRLLRWTLRLGLW